ncbi:hypothetical protein AMTRI_Chr13g123140 [Amborella trichopoda]
MGIKAVIVLFLVFSFCFDLTKAIPNIPMQTQHGATMKVEEGLELGAHFGGKVLALEVTTEFDSKFGGDRRILKRVIRRRSRLSNGAAAPDSQQNRAGPSRHGSFKWAIFGILSMWVFLV